MKPIIRDNGKNITPTPLCAKCGKELPYKHYKNEYGTPCVDTSVITWNFCPECGEEIEGYKEAK